MDPRRNGRGWEGRCHECSAKVPRHQGSDDASRHSQTCPCPILDLVRKTKNILFSPFHFYNLKNFFKKSKLHAFWKKLRFTDLDPFIETFEVVIEKKVIKRVRASKVKGFV